MDIDQAVELSRAALLLTLMIGSPVMITAICVGLLISIFQSVTQIQDITLTFVPKIFVVMLSFVLFMPWMGDTLLGFVMPLLGSLDTIVR